METSDSSSQSPVGRALSPVSNPLGAQIFVLDFVWCLVTEELLQWVGLASNKSYLVAEIFVVQKHCFCGPCYTFPDSLKW